MACGRQEIPAERVGVSRAPLLRALLAVGLAATAPCAGQPVRVQRDIEFTSGLKADLYLPGDPRGAPAVVLLHGGGFTKGDRSQMDRTAQALAERGILAATIDYRLSEGSWFPATRLEDQGLRAAAARARDDALQAVGWLRSRSASLGFDGRRIVVAGYSAGGIAALEAATHGDAVAGGFAIAGAAADLDAIDAGDPPLVAAHGATDRMVPLALARATCERAERVGVPCELLVFPGVGHDVVGIERKRLLESLVAFTRRVPPRGPEGS